MDGLWHCRNHISIRFTCSCFHIRHVVCMLFFLVLGTAFLEHHGSLDVIHRRPGTSSLASIWSGETHQGKTMVMNGRFLIEEWEMNGYQWSFGLLLFFVGFDGILMGYQSDINGILMRISTSWRENIRLIVVINGDYCLLAGIHHW